LGRADAFAKPATTHLRSYCHKCLSLFVLLLLLMLLLLSSNILPPVPVSRPHSLNQILVVCCCGQRHNFYLAMLNGRATATATAACQFAILM